MCTYCLYRTCTAWSTLRPTRPGRRRSADGEPTLLGALDRLRHAVGGRRGIRHQPVSTESIRRRRRSTTSASSTTTSATNTVSIPLPGASPRRSCGRGRRAPDGGGYSTPSRIPPISASPTSGRPGAGGASLAGPVQLVLEMLLWLVGRYSEQGVMLHVCKMVLRHRLFRMTSSEVGARRALRAVGGAWRDSATMC